MLSYCVGSQTTGPLIFLYTDADIIHLKLHMYLLQTAVVGGFHVPGVSKKYPP